ncbi:neuroblast differentiation-associated protein AHNAK [Bufo gargarizans]|uniref:neuroblast differentiation-associated protein AHNAK n=1 Tax=Bufo gargarizans TaxID=30331 RepID=UPI001CF307F8|nr:neuroblast differentiation-associated protein AHNAK [Bufo gargarizans]
MAEEDTRELLLPNWKGSGTMGLTLDQNDEGVFVKQLVQNSPAAKTGVVREGDQIVGATVYFDNMSSEDIQKLLANVGQHTVGLKLQRKGDRSPQPGVTYSHDVFSLKSPDVVLSGDDEEYKRIYTKKIKPRLKSDETLEPETQTRTITVTRKVTAYTVDVTGSTDSKEIDISSPEYKIKIPRHEITEISKTSVETEEGKTMIKIPGIDVSGKSLQTSGESSVSLPGDSLNVHTTTARYKGQFAFPEGKNDANSQVGKLASAGIHVPDLSISGPKFQSYEKKIDVKTSRFGAEHIDFRSPNFMGASEEIGLEVKTPDRDTSTKSAVNIKESQSTTSKIGFQTSSTTVKGLQLDVKAPESLKSGTLNTSVRMPETDINISSTQSQFANVSGNIQTPKIDLHSQDKSGKSIEIALQGENIKMSNFTSMGPKLDTQFKLSQSSQEGLATTGANVDITSGFEGKANISKVNVTGPIVNLKGTDVELENSVGKISMPSFKVPKFGFSETNDETTQPELTLQGTNLPEGKSETWGVNVPKLSMPNVRIDTKGPSRRMGTEISGIESEHDLKFGVKFPEASIATKGVGIKGSNVSIEGKEGPVEIADVGGLEGGLKMPKFNLPKFTLSESKGGINPSDHQADIVGNLKPQALDIKSQFGNVEEGHLAKSSVSVSLPKISEPAMNLTLKGCKEIDISKPKINIMGPTADLDATDMNIGGKVEGLKFKVPPVQLPKSETKLKGPTIEGNLESVSDSIKVPEVEFEAAKINLGSPESKLSMPTFKMPKFGISESNLDGRRVDVDLPKLDVSTIDAKIDVDSSKLNTQSVNISLSKVPEVDLNVKGPKFEDAKGQKVAIKTPEVDLQAPDVELNGKVKGPKSKMPSVILPKIPMPDFDINLKGPKVEDIKGPKVDIKASEVELPKMRMPDVDLNLKGPKLEGNLNIRTQEVDLESPDIILKGSEGKLKMPKFGFSGQNVEGSEGDISLPTANLDVCGLDVETPEVKLKGPKLEMPSMNFNLPKISKPDFDLSMKGPKIEGDLKGPNIDIKAPEVDFKVPYVEVDDKVKGPKFKMPSVSVPKMTMPEFDINLKNSKLEGDIKGPKIDMKGPKVDLNAPEVDIDGKVKGSKLKMPSVNFPQISMPDVDLNMRGPNWKGGADILLPKAEGEVKGLNFDLKGAEFNADMTGVDLEGPEGKVRIPKFKMPKFGFSGSSVESTGLDVDIPKADLDLSEPELDVSGPDVKVKGSKFKMPSINFNRPKLSKPELTVKGPKIEGDVTIPKVDIKAPEIDIDAPDVNLDGKVKGPKFRMPSAHLPKMSMPDFDINLKGPKVEGDVKCPNVEMKAPDVHLEAPDVDLDGKVKGPKFRMPSVNLPKMSMPDFDINLKGPKVEGDVKGPKVDIKAPEVDLEAPDVNLDGKVKGPKFRMPSAQLPKMSMPDFDINLKGPKVEGDVKGPKVDIKAPEVDLEAPDVNLDGKVKGPKFRMPSVNLPKMSMPDFDINLKGPKVEGDVKGPKVDIKAPEVDLEAPDVNLDGKVKGPKFRMPSAHLPKMSMPNFDINLKGPKVEGDVKCPKVDIKAPEVDLEAPDVNLDGKVKGAKFRMPSAQLPKMSMPDFDINLKGPKVEGDVKCPKVDIKAPEVDLEAPDVNLDGKVKGPKFRMPSVNLPKMSMPDFDINLKGPKVEGDVKCPKVDIKAPEVDLEAPDINLDGKVKGPKFRMPSAHLPKMSMPDFDINLKGPKVEGDVKCPKVDIKAPEVDLEAPDVNLDGKVKGAKFRMPSVNLPKMSMPDFDINLKGPKVEGDVKGPKVEMKAPEVDLEAPDVDLDGKVKGPKFRMPSVNLPKMSMPDFDINLKGPKVEGDVKCPKVDIKAPEVDLEAPDVNLDGKVKGAKFRMPSAQLPKMSMPDFDINLKGPKVEGDVKGPKVDIKAPEVDLEAPDVNLDGKVKGAKFRMPSAQLPKMSMPDFDINLKGPKVEGDVKGPKVDIKAPEVDLEAPDVNLDGKVKGPKFRMPSVNLPKMSMPDFDINLKGPKVEGDVKCPKVDIKAPEVDLEAPDVNLDGKVKGAKFRMPSAQLPKMSMPDFDINLKGPKVEGDVKGPKVDIKAPEVDLEAPDVNLDGKVKGPKFRMPSVNLPKMSMPDFDINLKGPKVEGDVKCPKVDIKAPEVDLEAPDINLDGKVKGPKFRMPSAHLPKMSMPDFDINLKGPKVEGDVKCPKVDIKAPEVDLEAPDVNLDGKVKGPKFRMPSVNLPKMSMPDFDINLKGPKVEGDVKGPKVDIKAPEVDLEAPDVNLDGKVKGAKFRMPSAQLPKMSMPDFDINLKGPKVEGDVKGPKVEIKAPEVGLEAPDVDLDGKVKGPKFRMPSVNLPKMSMPDVDLNLKGPNWKGKTDYELPKVEGGVKGPEIDIGMPDVDSPEGKLKMPKFKMPKFGFSGPHVEGSSNLDLDISLPKMSMPDVDMNIKGPKWRGGEADISTPNLEVDLKGPAVDVKAPEVDIEGPEGKLKAPKIKMPKISMPDIDFNLKGPKIKAGGDIELGDAEIKLPKLEGDLKGPDFDLEVPIGNVELSEGKLKMPTFKMPKFGFSGPSAEGSGVDVDISGPKMNVKTPEVGVEIPGGKVKSPNVKVPSVNLNLQHVSMPDIDLNLKGPKLKGGIDGPDANIEADLKGPKIEIKGPEMQVPSSSLSAELPEGKVKGSKFKLPSWGFSKPSISIPDVDLNLKGSKVKGDLDITAKGGSLKGPELGVGLPEVDIDVPDAKVKKSKFRLPKFNFSGSKAASAEIKVPKPDVEVSGPDVDIPNLEAKGKAQKFKMPSLNITSPKMSVPDVELNLKEPKFEGDLKGPKIDIRSPDVEAAPDIDIDGKIKGGPKFKMSSMQFPKMSMPDVDLSLKGPKIEGDLKGPNIDIKGPELDIEGPDIELETPDVNLKGSEGKFKMPKFKMPKFGMSGPKVEGLNVDVSLPKGNVDVSGPSVDIKPPEIDIEGPEGKLKGPHLKMPKMPSMNIHAPKLSMPDFDLNLKGPRVEGDLKGPKVDIKCPEVDLDAPDIDVDGKVKGPKFGLSSIQIPKMSMPDVDFNLKGPKIEGDLKGPNIDIKGPELNVEGPDVELETPDINLRGSEGKFKMPKFNMPKFGMSGPKVEGLDIDFNLPKSNVDISGPSVDIKPPEIDIEGPEGKLKGPHLKMPKMPSMNIHAPKLSMPDFDLNLKGPKVEGDLKGPKGDIKCPEVDLDAPDIDVDGKDKGPKFGLPSMQFPKMSMPDVDFNLKGPKIEGDLKGPNIDIKGPELNVEGPDVELETPDIKLRGSEGKFKMPKFNMPKFGMSGPKVEGLDVDVSLPKGSVDVSGPSVDIKPPEIDIEGPEGKLKGPHLKMPKMPSMNIHAPKLSMPDFDLNLKGPKVEGDLKGPKVDIKCPEVDLDAPDIDVDGKVKGPKFGLSSIQIPKMSMPNVDLNLKGPKIEGDLKGPNIDIKGPELNVEGPDVELETPDINLRGSEGKFKMPKFNMPKFGMSGPKVEGLDVDVSLPKGSVDVSGPSVDIKPPEIDIEGPEGKLKGPHLKMPKMPSMNIHAPKLSMPDFDLNLKGPKVEGDLKGPKVDIKCPEVHLDAPDIDVDGKVKGPKFGLPSMHIPKMSMPDIDFNLKGPKIEGDLKGPNVDIKGPELDIEGPDIEFETPDVNLKGSEGKFKMPKFKMPKFGMSGPKVEGLDVDLNLPKGNVDISGPNVDIRPPEIDIEGPEGKLKGPHLKMPKMPSMNIHAPKISMPDFDLNLKGPKVEGDLKGPKGDIKCPEVDLDAPDIDVDGKVKGPKFRLPSMHIPKMSMPDVDFNLKGPKIEGDLKGPNIDIKGPELDFESPDIELETPDVNLKGSEGKFKMPKFKMPKFGMSGPKVEGLDVDLNLPKGNVDISGPNVDIRPPEIDIEGPEGKLKGPHLKMPKMPSMNIHAPKISMPDFDLNLKGPKVEGDLKGPKGDIKCPEVDLDAPDIDVDGKVKGPKFGLPSMQFPKMSMPDVDFNLKGPKIEGDLKGPNIDIKGPELDIEGPDIELETPDVNLKGSEGKFKMPKFKMPKFGMSGPKVEGLDVDLNLPKGNVDISGPNVDIRPPEIDIEGPEGKLKGPHLKMPKMPSMNIHAPKISMPDFDLNLKGPKVEGDLKGPKGDIKCPEVDLDAPDIDVDGKVKGPKFGLPSMQFPKMSMPDVDFNLKGPKIEGDLKGPNIDIKGPELDIEGPDIELETPDVNLKGSEGKFKMPKFKMPKFGMSGPKVEGLDVDLNLPKSSVDISGPSVDIKPPEIDIEGPEGKLKGPHLKMPKMPSMNIHAPKLSMPDFDLNLKGPKVEGDLKGPKGDIKCPEVDLDAPDIDVDGKVKGPKFGLPSMQFPKMSMPDVDFNLKGPKIEGDLKGPNIDIKGPELDIEGPDIELETPDVNLKGSEGKFKMPKFKMPKFGMSGPKVEGLDVDLNLPKGNVDISGPSVDIKPPEIDMEGPEGKLKGPHLKMPKMPSMNIHAPKLSMPDFDLNLKGPKVEGDLKGPKGDIKCPEVHLDAPDIDVDGKVKGPKFGLPSMHIPKMSMPDVDFNLKGPKIEGDLKGPNIDIKGPELDIEGPDFELETPDVNLKGSEGKFKMPKFKMPKFGMSGPKVEGLDVDLNLPKGNVDISGPSVDIKSPEIDIEGPEGKLKGPHLKMPKMPSMNIHAPKLSMPDFDLNLKGPKVEGDLKGPKGDIKCPEVHLDAPDIDVDGKVKGPKFGLPSMHIPKMSMPDVDFNLKGPKIEGDLKGPNIDIKGPELDIEGPDFELETPDVNLKGSEGKFKMPKFKMPKFGMSGPKVEGLDVDLNLPKGNVDISGPNVDIKSPEIDIEGPEGKLKGPHLKMPSMNIHAPKLSMPDFDLNLKGPKVEGNLKGPKGNIKCPEVDLDAPDIDVDGKVKGPKFGLPSMQFPKMSMPDVDLNLKGPKIERDLKGPNIDIKGPKLDIEGPDIELETPDVNLKGSEGKFKMPKFKMPKFGMSGPKVEGLDVDLNLPKGNVDISGPSVDIKPPEIDIEGPEGKLKGPHLKMPKMPSMNIHAPKLSMPDLDLNLKGPKVEGDLKGPKVDIKCPEVDLGAPDIDVDVKVKGPKFGLPSMHIPKMSMPDVDFNLKGPKIEGDLKGPNIDIKGPELNVEGPDVELETPDINLRGSEGKFKMPKFNMPKFGMSGPKVEGLNVDVSLPKGNVDISGPSVDIKPPEIDIEGPEGKLKGPHLKMPKMPSMNIHTPKLSMPDFDLNLKGPKVEGDLKGPKGDIKCPEVHLDAPDIDVDGKVKGPKFGLPSMQFPKMSMPDVDFNLKGPKIEGDLKGPNIDIKGPELNVEGPDVELETPDINLRGSEGKFKMPKFNMPKFGMSGPKVEGLNVDVSLPKGNVDISGPSVDIKPPEIDIEGPEGKLKGPHLKMPKMPSMNIHTPKLSMPDFDLNLKGPKVEGDLKGPKVNIKGPEVDLDVPEIDVDGKVKGPNLEGDLKVPNINIKGPKLDAGAPDVDLQIGDVNLKGSEGKLKMPKFKLPKFDISGPKGGLDVDVSPPKGNFAISGDLALSSPKIETALPEVEFEGPDGKMKGSKLKMPSLNLPDVSMPEISLKGPKIKGDVDLSGPKLEGDVSLKNPNLKGDFEVTGPQLGDLKSSEIDVDIDLPEGNLKVPKVKKPKFGFGIKSPKAEVKSPSVDVSVPDVDFDSEIPDVSVSGKGKKGKFKMPKIHMSGPKIKGKKGGFDVSTPNTDNDLNLNAPDVDLNLPGGDIEVKTEIGLKAHKTRKPLFGKLHFPDVEFDIKSPKLKGDGSLQSPKADIKTPDLDIGGGVKMQEADLTTSGVNIEGPDIKMKKNKFKLPGFSMSGPKVEVPGADLLLSKGSVDLSGPKIDVAAPNLDVKTGAMSSNSKLPSLSADMFAPKISVPDIDLNLQGPNVKADKVGSVDINPPNIDTSGISGKFNVPEFGISGLPRGGADVNFDTKFKTTKQDSSFQGPSITTSATDITFPKVTGSNLDISLREPKIEGNFGSSPGVDLPSVNVKGIGMQAGLSGQQLQLQGPQVRLPKGDFSVSKPKTDISGKDVALDINIKGSSFQTSPGSTFSAPGINVNGQGVDLKGDLLGGVGYFKGADRLRIEGTQVEGDLTGHKVEGGLNVTPIDMNLESSTGKITFPRLLMPKFSASGLEPSGREVGVDVDFPSSDVQFVKSGQADVDLEESDIKVKKSKIKMPKLNFRSKGKGDTSLPDVSMSGSKGDFQSSKVTLGSAEGGLGSANLEVEKPAKYEFSLFTSKKTRHRSSSLSEEKDESTHSSPSGTLEAGGSLAVEGGKKKGKHSKIKFGTFGGLGSKSKGSYEVTLSDDENIQGSGASLSSRKSRVSSSSSNDSATKAGVRLPKVELTVAKKKE